MLHLTEDDVRRLLPMDAAIDAVAVALRQVALDEAVNAPRQRVQTDHVMLHVLPAAAKRLGYVGFKAYSTGKRGALFHVLLYDGKSGELVAMIQADHLGQVRTGAASGVATRLLARTDADTAGILGTGKQARTQLEAICRVRPIRDVAVWSRDEANRTAFAAEMSERLQVRVRPVATAEAAVRDRAIVCTATTAREPILLGEWLAPGTHVNAVGSNFLAKAEIDAEAVRRASVVTVDSKEQAKLEAGDLVASLDAKLLAWLDVTELGQVLAGRVPGRAADADVTLFKSVGIGIEDIAVASVVVAGARAAGVGRTIEV